MDSRGLVVQLPPELNAYLEEQVARGVRSKAAALVALLWEARRLGLQVGLQVSERNGT